ncbi:MAG TPA: S41 family peptidase [Thermoanaerobaculia bacterium]|nr:S41 family peptidase [Thermoanaerobaculia bacterium]
MLSEPALSPDGREIAFVAGGDIWTVAASGGEARLLVSDPATESRPFFSPDGQKLAFISSRTGNGDIYVVDLGSGAMQRITWDDGRDQLDGWSRDGKWLYFSSTSRDISGMNDVWRVASTGGTPMQVQSERYVSEYFAAPSPDGNTLAFVARGVAVGQWWRHGSSHMDQTQIWTVDLKTKSYAPRTQDGAREIWPMWSADGKRLYFVSDRGGTENLWSLDSAGAAAQHTNFKDGRVLWPAIANDGRAIVFERDFGIWRFDTGSGKAAPVDVTLRGVSAAQAIEHRRLNDRFSDLAVSPDGKKVAFIARGEVFAASAKDGGDALRVTTTPALESQITWSPDSKSIVYISDRGGRAHLYQYDFATEKESALTSGETEEDTPRFSPDGKRIAFQRNRKEIAVFDVATKQTRTAATTLLDRPPLGSDRPFAWSPDSKWIAYLGYGPHLFRNVWVVPAAGGDSRQVSFLANVNSDYVTWSGDGKFILVATSQRSEQGQIARIDLVPTTPKFKEDQFRDLFREPKDEKKDDTPKPSPDVKPADAKTADAKAADAKSDAKGDAKSGDAKSDAKKVPPVEIDFNNIRNRATLIPVGMDAGSVDTSSDGKWIAFTAALGDSENVYVYSIDELSSDPAVPKQLSASSGRKSNMQFSADGKEVYYLDGGRIAAATVDPVKARSIAVTAEMDVDFAREKDEAFSQAWRYLRDNFYDPEMHGADWNAVRESLAPRVAAARTGDEFRRLMQLMVGELNASHSGASAPGDTVRTNTGRIGIRFDRDEYEKNGRLRVSEVLPLSPAEIAKIKVGDVITAVDGKSITNFDAAMEHTIDKRTVITLDGTPKRDVIVRPVRGGDEKGLTYRAWVNANRDYVARISNGLLGYVHMFDMTGESLNQLYLDLDAENRAREGVVIDIRNNNGGFVNAYAIDVFSRRPYLTMTFRDFPPAPARSVLGQRSLEKPTVLVQNRHSLSDAEDFSEGYRALGLGKIVGEPTAGWIIYTSNIPLIDGTVLRIPFIKITGAKGDNMERSPRPVDVMVQRNIGESGDSQLDRAVKELLADLK